MSWKLLKRFDESFLKSSKTLEKMASGDAAVAAPTVWAMRTDKVYIEFQVILEFSHSLVTFFLPTGCS